MKFGVECQSTLKSRQLMALQEALLRNRADGRPSLLIVDEAQRLSTELLEEIRLLLNMETPREKLLDIIISGQPELAEILGRPELRQLKQRVSCICKLEALSLEELHEYLDHRLTLAGLPNQTLFSEEVIQLIYNYTQGIPRLVNSLCNNVLQTGFAMQSRNITIPIVEEAARDLELRPVPEMLPVPNNRVAPITASAEVAMAAPRLAAVNKKAVNGALRTSHAVGKLCDAPEEPWIFRRPDGSLEMIFDSKTRGIWPTEWHCLNKYRGVGFSGMLLGGFWS